MSKEKNNKSFLPDQIRLEVAIINDTPILNVFLEDGSWFPISPDNVRVTKGSQCHPKIYEKIWGKPLPTLEESAEATKE